MGRGGFGVVYRAWDLELEREIALKLLNPDLAADGDWKKRFRQEATAASKFSHPNITVVFDRGECQSQPYIVMELVEGEPLSRLIERRVPLTDPERLFLIEQLCDGLHYAHQRHIIHRDIKPVNLVVHEDNDGTQVVRTLKILDFGIAKSVNTGQTSTGHMMFTPNYVSPEQILGDEVDGRADMFAVGCVAYELLTFEKAFAITSTNPFSLLDEVKRKIAVQPHRPMTVVRADVDPELSSIVDRALAKRAEDRFRDLSEMRRHLHHVRVRFEAAEPHTSQTTVVLNPTQQVAVKRAREALDADDPAAAINSLQLALSLASNRVVRRFIEQELEDAQEKQAAKNARQELAAAERAQTAIASARAAFAAGSHDDAIRSLERFDEPQRVRRALDTLREGQRVLEAASSAVRTGGRQRRARALEKLEAFADRELIAAAVVDLRRVDAEFRDRENHERAAAAAIDAARKRFESGNRAGAISRLERFHPPHNAVSAMLGELRERARQLDETEARAAEQRQAALERRPSTASVGAVLAEEARELETRARDLFVHGSVDDALGLLNAFRAPDLVVGTRTALHAAAQEIQAARTAVAREPAFIRRTTIERLERMTPRDLFERAIAQLRKIDDERTSAEKREDVERIAAAAERAAWTAREQFARGEHRAALKALESYVPAHAVITQTLGELRAEVDRREAEHHAKQEEQRRRLAAEQAALRAKQEEERTRVAAERAKKVHEVSALLAEAESAVTAERLDDAAVLLDRASKLLPGSSDVAGARSRLAGGIRIRDARLKRERISEILRRIDGDIHAGRLTAAGEGLSEAAALGAADAELGPLRDRLGLAQPEYALISSGLSALREALTAAKATTDPASRLTLLDRVLTNVVEQPPPTSAAAALWIEYQHALGQARSLRKDAAIEEVRARIDEELRRRSVRNAERALREAESTYPGLEIWIPLRSELEALRNSRPALRQIPASIAAGIAAVAVAATILAIWRPWIRTSPPSKPAAVKTQTPKRPSPFEQATSRLAAGQRREALDLALQSLKADPQDEQMAQLLTRLRSDASSAVSAARGKAVAAGAVSRASFRAAEQKTADAQAITEPLRTGDAIRAFEDAADLYRNSETEAFSVEEFLDAARKERTGGRIDRGVKYAIDGLKQYPGDDRLVGFLRMLRLEASSRVATARTAAQRAGSTQASAAFKDAQEKERFANARSAPEQTSDTLTALRDAEARYREAEKEAIDARASMRWYPRFSEGADRTGGPDRRCRHACQGPRHRSEELGVARCSSDYRGDSRDQRQCRKTRSRYGERVEPATIRRGEFPFSVSRKGESDGPSRSGGSRRSRLHRRGGSLPRGCRASEGGSAISRFRSYHSGCHADARSVPGRVREPGSPTRPPHPAC